MSSKNPSDSGQPDFRLHTFYRSSCSGRLRIALNLKGIASDYEYVRLHKDEQHADSFPNPSASVPVLTHLVSNGPSFPIGQSVAALEYLEEVFEDQIPLLPPLSQPLERAKVRTLMSILTIDLQPITNRRIGKDLAELGVDPMEWNRSHTARGLQPYEALIEKTAGKFSVGDSVTLADVCLIPAMWNAEKLGVDLKGFPTITRVYQALSELDAVKRSHWSVQEDTPEDLSWL